MNAANDIHARFEPGRTYSARSLCDHATIFLITVLSRTAQTVTVDRDGKRKGCRIARSYDGAAETIKPWGNYSMCPVIRADRSAK